MLQIQALSIVSPNGSRIAMHEKTLEVRSWKPEILPIRDLLIVENMRRLKQDNDADDEAFVVAVVDVVGCHAWREDEVQAACATKWEDGYWAWELSNVRHVSYGQKVTAKKGIYTVVFTDSRIVDGFPYRWSRDELYDDEPRFKK